MTDCSALCIVIITLFFPPLGVFLISGCSTDFLINILLTILGYFPGHVHAFYLEYVYYHRQKMAATGLVYTKPATGVYSDRIQNGGHHHHAPQGNTYAPQGTTYAPQGNTYAPQQAPQGTTYGTV